MPRDCGVEVSVVLTRGGAVRVYLGIAVDLSDTDGFSGIAVGRGLIPQEALFKPDLGLRAQVVVQARQDDDDLVARVGGLANQARIVPGLAGLDVPHDEAATIP